MFGRFATRWDWTNSVVHEQSGGTWTIERFAFHPRRIHTFSSLFKLPELGYRDVLTFTGGYAQEKHEDFYLSYRAAGLTGLMFEEIWSE